MSLLQHKQLYESRNVLSTTSSDLMDCEPFAIDLSYEEGPEISERPLHISIEPHGKKSVFAAPRQYWASSAGFLSWPGFEDHLMLEAMDELFAAPQDFTLTTSSSLYLVEDAEPEENRLPRLIAIQPHRKEIFSQELTLKISKLPRLQPRITATSRMLRAEDE